MPTIKVNTRKLASYESDLQRILNRVNSIKNEFSSTSSNLDWDVKASSNINYRLSAINRELSAEARGISGMKNFLDTAQRKYDAVEEKNGSAKKNKNTYGKAVKDVRIHGGAGKTFEIGSAKRVHSGAGKSWNVTVDSSTKETAESKSFWEKGVGKWLKDTVSEGLVAGTLIKASDTVSIFRNGFTNIDVPTGIKKAVDLYKNASGTVKNAVKIGKAISATSKTIKTQNALINSYGISARNIGRAKQVISNAKSDTIKKLVGFDDSLSDAAQSANVFLKNKVVTQSWGARFADQFTDSVKSSTKGLVKPAGIISSALTVVTSGVDNYNEFKSGKITGGRAVAETVTESIIDIGTGIAVGAAVTAGLAATVGSAPVLAVAAISTGVIMGADALCKCITKKVTGEEKGLTETVSDFVLDTGKKVIENKVQKAKTIFNIGSKAVKEIFGG